LDLLENVALKTDDKGYFKAFDDNGAEFKSLQELVDSNKSFIEWRYENITIDDIPNS
jgi:hypothetical protein